MIYKCITTNISIFEYYFYFVSRLAVITKIESRQPSESSTDFLGALVHCTLKAFTIAINSLKKPPFCSPLSGTLLRKYVRNARERQS